MQFHGIYEGVTRVSRELNHISSLPQENPLFSTWPPPRTAAPPPDTLLGDNLGSSPEQPSPPRREVHLPARMRNAWPESAGTAASGFESPLRSDLRQGNPAAGTALAAGAGARQDPSIPASSGGHSRPHTERPHSEQPPRNPATSAAPGGAFVWPEFTGTTSSGPAPLRRDSPQQPRSLFGGAAPAGPALTAAAPAAAVRLELSGATAASGVDSFSRRAEAGADADRPGSPVDAASPPPPTREARKALLDRYFPSVAGSEMAQDLAAGSVRRGSAYDAAPGTPRGPRTGMTLNSVCMSISQCFLVLTGCHLQ